MSSMSRLHFTLQEQGYFPDKWWHQSNRPFPRSRTGNFYCGSCGKGKGEYWREDGRSYCENHKSAIKANRLQTARYDYYNPKQKNKAKQNQQ